MVRTGPGKGESPTASLQRQHYLHKPPSGVPAWDAGAAGSHHPQETTPANPQHSLRPPQAPPTQCSLSLEMAETGRRRDALLMWGDSRRQGAAL